MKLLLCCLFAMCTWCCLAHSAAAASPQSSTVPPQQPTRPPDTLDEPAPIVRRPPPKPLIIKPGPGATAPPGSTAATGQAAPVRPRPAPPASDATGNTGLPARPKPKPATTEADGNSPATPHPAKSALPTTAPARVLLSGTAPVLFNRTTVVLDPAHGGVDGGSRITDTLQEKDVDLAFAFKLRSLLTARGFNVVLTREADAATPPDAGTPLTLDDRAGIANHLHPVACLLLHSTGSGKGIHLYSSELSPTGLQPAVVPWLTAQASWVEASRALQKQLGTALTRAEIPLVLSRASVRPLDSLACPALVLELAPDGSDKGSVNDPAYQARVANALAAAMIFWQNLAQAPDRQVPTPPASSPAVMPSPTATPGAQP